MMVVGASKTSRAILRRRRETSTVLATLLAILLPQVVLGQSATPGAVVVLDPLVVTGPSGAEKQARETLRALPGGTGLVGADDLAGRADPKLSDTLASVPGVIVQNFFGGNDQPRVQIRGSGLQQNPVERGVLVLQNGLPLNHADGSYIVGLADPGQAQFTEVYRGYTANRLGATVLGGALNFVLPTGSSAPGLEAGVAGGSFGQLSATARAGGRRDRFDGLLQVGFSRRDGYRDHNESDRVSLDVNFGVEVNDAVSSRFFLGYTDLNFDVAGPLSRPQLDRNPKRVHSGPRVRPNPMSPPRLLVSDPGPNVPRDKPERTVDQFRVGNRTTLKFGGHSVDGVLGYADTDDTFRFPTPNGIRETDGGDFSSVLRYAYRSDEHQPLPLFDLTAKYVIGWADRKNFINNAGREGPLFGRSAFDADTLSLYAGLNVPLGAVFTLSPAIAYAKADRDHADTFGAARRPTAAFNPLRPTQPLPNGFVPAGDTSYAQTYSGWSPSLGLTIRPTEHHTIFAAVSRSFEPPTHNDLIATINGTPNSSPGRPDPGNPAFSAAAFSTPDLKAQRATTVEAGWRGRYGMVAWEAVAYYAWIGNELLGLRDESGAPLAAVNANRTTHLGLEFGFDVQWTEKVGSRFAYTFQDFRFDGDAVRGDNDLAGAPPHSLDAVFQYDLLSNLFLQAQVHARPARTPVDNMNTLYADPFVTLDVRARYDIRTWFGIFGEVRNLADETSASSTLIADQARPDQAAFLPGDGRAFSAGVEVLF